MPCCGTAGPGRYPSRSEAVFAVAAGMVQAGYTDAEAVATLCAAPWVVAGRRDPAGHMAAEVRRARPKGAVPCAPAAPEDALPANRALPAEVRRLLASARPERRRAGAVRAVAAGMAPSAVAAVLVAAGMDPADAAGLARWACRQATHTRGGASA